MVPRALNLSNRGGGGILPRQPRYSGDAMAAVAITAFVIGRLSASDEAPAPIVAVPTAVSGTAPTATQSAVPAADVPADEVITDHVTPLTSASQDEEN